FATTWDNTFIYAYTRRAGSRSNQTSFGYYADTNNNGRMETGEPLVVIGWQGRNRSVDVGGCTYVAVNPFGDPLVGANGYADGYNMPGNVIDVVNLRSGNWGSADGYSMEWAVSWAELGILPGSAIRWHTATDKGNFKP